MRQPLPKPCGKPTELLSQLRATKTADKLEADMEMAVRVLQRLEVQRDALVSQINDAAKVERATHAARLKKGADALLAQSIEKFGGLESLAAALSAAVDALTTDYDKYGRKLKNGSPSVTTARPVRPRHSEPFLDNPTDAAAGRFLLA